jgi:Tfp pilus assembly protein PilO
METKNENPTIISQKDNKPTKWTLETKSLVALLVIFAVVLLGAWGFAIRLKQTVAANNSATHADPAALIEVERLRNLSAAQIDDGRAFFLLGSSSLFEKQRTERAEMGRALTDFQEKFSLPQES